MELGQGLEVQNSPQAFSYVLRKAVGGLFLLLGSIFLLTSAYQSLKSPLGPGLAFGVLSLLCFIAGGFLLLRKY